MPSALSGATVLLAAGGTGGHLQPALAVAAEAQARGARVVLVTTPSQVERVREQYTTYALELKGFERRVDVRAYARTFRLLGAAVPHVRRILKETRPDVAVGGGGFASGPVVAVAAASGVPGLALEADAHLGVANRLLRPFVKRFCLSFPIEGLEPPRYVVTGRPLSPGQLDATPEEGREAFDAARRPAGRPGVRRQPGRAEHQPRLHRRVRRQGPGVPARARVRAPQRRPGAQASWRNAGSGLSATAWCPTLTAWPPPWRRPTWSWRARADRSPSSPPSASQRILVPYPHATADHQRKNAQEMVAGGAALLVDDAELDGALLGRLTGELLGDRERLAAMAAASAALGRPDAAQRVADQVEDILTRRRRR